MFFNRRTNRPGTKNNSSAGTVSYFYRYHAIWFLGYTTLGVVFAHLFATWDFFANHFSASLLFLTSTEWATFPKAAAIRSLPIFMIYLLGIREYDFFCLSRFWTFLFCSMHGVVLYQTCRNAGTLLIEQKDHKESSKMMLSVLLLTAFFALLAFLYTRLLHAMRVGARGLPLPCLGHAQKISFVQRQKPEQRRKQLTAYAKDGMGTLVACYLAECALMICYRLQFLA